MISIVIVNWNAGPLLERCLRSLDEHAAGCEIILVDNASNDGSLDFLSGVTSAVRVDRIQKNLGFAAASNIGWRASAGDPILFLNPDTECREGSILKLEETLISDASTWAAGGSLTGLSGKPQIGFNVRAFPTIGSVAAEILLLDEVWAGNPWTRRYRMSDWDHGSIRQVDQPAAACLMVRRKALELLRGFDESFRPAWFEDVDLCKRIRDAGGRILFQPAARFLHHGGTSRSHLSPEEFLEYYHTNQIRYFAKHHGHHAAMRVRKLVVAGLRLRAVLSWLRPVAPGVARMKSAGIFRRVAARLSSVPETLA